MTPVRNLPDFNKIGANDFLAAAGFGIFGGLFYMIIVIFIAKKTIADWFGFLLGLILILVFFTVSIGYIRHGFSLLKKRREWMRAAATTQTIIVKREGNVRYADDYSKYGPFWQLYLEIVPDQLVTNPGESLVVANVSKSLYKRYAGQNKVRIYYFPSTPLVFLIEGE
jgi:hypothetical protein